LGSFVSYRALRVNIGYWLVLASFERDNALERQDHSGLRAEDAFLKQVVTKEIPFLGICLGGQLLAKACGARISKSPVREIGWHDVMLTAHGKRDDLFKGLPERMPVYQWHEDTFAVPESGALLATSGGCPNQAFRIGSCAYGLQFHPEVTRK
jgi:GMP synthase (glutamine-hydrolysing)